MKRIIIILFAFLPMLAQAGVIMKRSGERLEDVTIKSVTDSEVVYELSGQEMTLLKSDVSAILYDDGRYEEIKQTPLKTLLEDVREGDSGTTLTNQLLSPDELSSGQAISFTWDLGVYTYGHPKQIKQYKAAAKRAKELGVSDACFSVALEAYQTKKQAGESGNKACQAFIDVYISAVNKIATQGAEGVLLMEASQEAPQGELQEERNNGSNVFVDKREEAEQKRIRKAEEKRLQDSIQAAAAEQARLDEERKLQDGQIHRLSSNSWYYIDKYYNKKDIQSIIVTDCPDAQQYYKKAKKWVVGGWSGVGAGLALLIAGSVMTPIGIANETQQYWVDGYSEPWYYVDYWGNTSIGGYNEIPGYYATRHNDDAFALLITGITCLTIGSAGIVTSLTIACIGHHRMNNSYKIYNSSCATKHEQPALSLNFAPTRNGLGMTLHF